MESKKSMFWVAALSGAVGAGFGSVSGSNSLVITFVVGAVLALLVAWGISGFLK
jgi:hypothetical protein|tara:strand:- start:1142 stop:1303 length:162 start_codon:yes stop_codon:yes gene_type:complete